jgi:hypothetical protein
MTDWIRNPQLGYARRIVTMLDDKAWEVDYLVSKDELLTKHSVPRVSRSTRAWANAHRWRLTARVTRDALGSGHPDKYTYLMRTDDSEGYSTMAAAQAAAEWTAVHGFHHVPARGWTPNGEGMYAAQRESLGLPVKDRVRDLP